MITGAEGFIGKHLIEKLSKMANFEIHGICHPEFKNTSDELGVQWHSSNLLDIQAQNELLKKVSPTHLVHLAWITKHGVYWNSLENYDWLYAGIAMLRKFAELGGQRAFFAGTCAEYEWRDGICQEEVTPLVPKTNYGICKKLLYNVASAFAEQTGFNFAWGRFFHLYGPHEHPQRLLPSLIIPLLSNKRARCTVGAQIRDFLHVDDAANAILSLLDSHLQGAVNIASGKTFSIREFALMSAGILHKENEIDFGALPIFPDDPPVLTADVSRLRNEVGFSPAIELSEGLLHTIDWWKLELEKKERT